MRVAFPALASSRMRALVLPAVLATASLAACHEPPLLDRTAGACWAFQGDDPDCDGRAERHCLLQTFTKDGVQQTYQNDEDCDGRLSNRTDRYEDGVGEACVVSRFDERGREVERDEDRFCTGDPDTCTLYEWDEMDRKVGEQSLPGCRGPGTCFRWTYAGDAAVPIRQETDDGCDGRPEWCTTTVLDAAGRVLSDRWDEGCDGRDDAQCVARTWRDDGQLLTERWDLDCDGTDDRNCTENTYDDAGRLVATRYDFLCDGAEPICTRIERDAAGGIAWQGDDHGCDGTFDKECRTIVRDAQGAVVSTELRIDCDARDDCTTTTWSDDHRSYRFERSTPCDAPPTICLGADVDDRGRDVRTRADSDCDGTPDSCGETTYAGDLPMMTTTDAGCDGTVDVRSVQAWDGAGNRLSSSYDGDGDGRPDACTIRETTCGTKVLD